MKLFNKEVSNQRVITAVVILMIFLGGGIFVWQLHKKENAQAEERAEELRQWGIVLPEKIQHLDDRKAASALPFVNNSHLAFLDLSTYVSKETDQLVDQYSDDVLIDSISPNFKKFAFLDNNGNFRVATTDLTTNIIVVGLDNYKLTSKPRIDIKAWSKDSNRLIFRISSGDGEMGPAPVRQKNEEDFLKTFLGYYLIDSTRNKVEKLDISSDTKSIIPISSTEFLLVRYNNGVDQLEIFDAGTFHIKHLADVKGYYGQYSADQSGYHWSFSMATQIGEDVSVVYGKFPALSGETIAKGPWAEVQWPVISPDGEKVLFVKAVDSRTNLFSLWVYDSKDRSSKVLMGNDSSGRYFPEVWIDNERFIFSHMGPLQGIASRDFLVYDFRDNSIRSLKTKETTSQSIFDNNSLVTTIEEYTSDKKCQFSLFEYKWEPTLYDPNIKKEIVCSFFIHTSLPEYIFRITGKTGDNEVEKVETLQAEKKVILQTSAGWQPGFDMVDFVLQDANFDGYSDVMTFIGEGHGVGSCVLSRVWVFDAQNKTFRSPIDLPGCSPRFDDEKHEIATSVQWSTYTLIYQWVDGELVLVKAKNSENKEFPISETCRKTKYLDCLP